jgi:uncharacterized paraquat-inducible protein A
MYCSSCGSAIPANLAYCNRCGAKTSGAKPENFYRQSSTFPESLVWATVSVFVGGMGVIIGLMAVMKNVVGFSPKFIFAVTALCFGLMVILEAVLIWMLFTARRDSLRMNELERVREHKTRELEEVPLRALPEPIGSVTEHTTRTFDPILLSKRVSSELTPE